MADTPTYKSTLTGPELDEALRNIGKVQDNIEKAAGYAETAEQYGTIVEQNQTAIQAIEDNLPAVQGAAANAQSAAANAQAAAQSAQEAQTAAQQALGFRMFFSAVSPDANGDLDPSRPMNTPTAQASWTIKSKGDRIQSVQVNGFTTQAGTGDPSPTNVRKISTAGMRMVELVLNGTENWALRSAGSNGAQFEMPLTDAPSAGTDQTLASQTQKCSICIVNNADNYPGDCAWAFSTGGQSRLRVRMFRATTVGALKRELSSRYAAGNPVIFWYVPADESQATGLYIPIQAQGHEYRCKMLELTAPLCDGDKVESNVPSGCDKKIVLDGSSDEVWTQSPSAPTWFTCAISFDYSLVYSSYLSNGGSQVSGAPLNSFVLIGTAIYINIDGLSNVSSLKARLSQKPLTFFVRSTAYTEANDIPVELETHKMAVRVLDGMEAFSLASSPSNTFQSYSLVNGKNFTVVSNQYKNGGSTWNSMPDFSVLNSGIILGFRDSRFSTAEEFKANLSSQYSAGTPVTVVYELATPAVYAHDSVELVAVPYTEADATSAQQLANTPSTLPYIDSADVPMLLDETGMSEPDVTVQSDGTLDAENTQKAAEWVRETAQRLMAAPLASAPPVAGTYVVSSQDGTTVLVSLKAMQDGGDAATVGGESLEQIKAAFPIIQSGTVQTTTIGPLQDLPIDITFTTPMPDNNYAVSFGVYLGTGYWSVLRCRCTSKRTDGFGLDVRNDASDGSADPASIEWIAVHQ